MPASVILSPHSPDDALVSLTAVVQPPRNTAGMTMVEADGDGADVTVPDGEVDRDGDPAGDVDAPAGDPAHAASITTIKMHAASGLT